MTSQLPLSSFILNPIDMGHLWKWLATGRCSHLIPIHERRHFLSLWFVFPFGLVVSPQGIPEASAAEVYCEALVKTVVGRQRQWQYLLWHHIQCQHSSSSGLNSIKTEGHLPQAPKTHWLLFIQHNFNGSVGGGTRLSFPFPVILQLRVGGMEGILPAQQKQALLKELCTNRWKNGEAGRNNIQLFFLFWANFPRRICIHIFGILQRSEGHQHNLITLRGS